MIDNQSQNEPFLQIDVRNPRTHISREKALYTDYEITVKTNNIAFSCSESCVRRRYSDFQWLRKRLIILYKWVTCPPELPPKRLFGRFQRQFLKRRQQGLQKFLEGIVDDNQYLSDVAIHLFLQSNLPVKEIERHLDGGGYTSDADLLDSLQPQAKGSQLALSRSMTEMPSNEVEKYPEHDSGCCYSTTSSINDLNHTPVIKTRDDWRYYMSLPANLDKFDGSECADKTLQQDTGCGQLSQVDSGHLTSGSHQSLNMSSCSSESDCDFMSVDYDADEESNTGDEELGTADNLGSHCSLFELDKRFRLERALDILRSRPMLLERVFTSDDTDEEFNEAEYDVIESHDEKDNRTPTRKRSASKKKLGRSLSDATKTRRKLTRSKSQSFSNKTDQSGKNEAFQSMPNIRALTAARLTKSALYDTRFLAAHREEDAEMETELLASSEIPLGIPRKSDDAEESVVPNSEMDCYSTWNITPSKSKSFFIDSSDTDLGCMNNDYHVPRLNLERQLLERLTASHHGSPWSNSSGSPTLVSGRFRVSVIREEENTSRRDSLSSNDLTLKLLSNSGPDTEKQNPAITPTGFKRYSATSPKTSARRINFDETSDEDHQVSCRSFINQKEDGASDNKVDNEDAVGDLIEVLPNSTSNCDTLDSDKLDNIKTNNVVPSLLCLASAMLCRHADAKQGRIHEVSMSTNTSVLENTTIVAGCFDPIATCQAEIEERCFAIPVTGDVNAPPENNSPVEANNDSMEQVVYNHNNSSLVNSNFSIDYLMRERAASPTAVVLKTYDVIPEMPCCLEDYDIVDAARDRVISTG